jgi:hypothetical protein
MSSVSGARLRGESAAGEEGRGEREERVSGRRRWAGSEGEREVKVKKRRVKV